jgi:outer membrane protein
MKNILSTCILLFSVALVQAQDAPIKNEELKALIQKAVNNFPRIKELETQLQLKNVKDELTNAQWQPTVYADISDRISGPIPKAEIVTPAGKVDIKFAPLNNYSATLNAQQLLYDFGKIKFQLQRNKAEQAVLETNIENSKNAIAYQVVQTYYSMQFLQKAIKVQEEQIATLKENEKLIDNKIKAGDALEYDLLTTQVRTSNANNKLNDLQNQLDKQFVLLQYFTGEDSKGKLNLMANDDALVLQNETADWKSFNGEVKLIDKKVSALQLEKEAAWINNKPSVFASASGGVRNGIQPDIEGASLAGGIGVGISIPIVSGARPKVQQKLTQIQIDATKQQLNTLQINMQKDLATVNMDYKNLQQKLANTEILLKQAEKAYQLAEIRFKAGLITNVELLSAQTFVEEAKLSQVQLQYQMQLDRLESHKMVGTKLF